MSGDIKKLDPIIMLNTFKKHALYKYVISFGIVTFASILQSLLWNYIEPASFLLFYPAIILACIYGDGNFAIVLSTLMGQYFFIKTPEGVFAVWPHDYIRIALFLMAALMIRKIIHNQLLERLKAESAVTMLKQKERDLKIEKEARERFVTTINHDLQNPLTAIKIASEIMMKKINNPEIISKNIYRQLISISRMENMINNLLDANRIHAGNKLIIQVESCELNLILENAVADLETLHGNRFKLKMEKAISGYWSHEGIRRILDNLCSNAVKYGSADFDIIINADQQEAGVIISVNNKGPVIPEEDLASLFDFHKRAAIAIESNIKGWGLGLTLVKGIAEAHGGSVRVVSNESEGTTFTVYLPNDSREYIKALPTQVLT